MQIFYEFPLIIVRVNNDSFMLFHVMLGLVNKKIAFFAKVNIFTEEKLLMQYLLSLCGHDLSRLSGMQKYLNPSTFL